MKYRTLGGTDLKVSVICLGPMRAAAREPGNDEKSQAGERALRDALDAGVNFLHSSYEYGTRWMMGRALKDHPAAKCSAEQAPLLGRWLAVVLAVRPVRTTLAS